MRNFPFFMLAITLSGVWSANFFQKAVSILKKTLNLTLKPFTPAQNDNAGITKVECSADPTLANDLKCFFIALPKKLDGSLLTASSVMLVLVPDINMQIRQFRKVGQKWTRGNVDVNANVCEMTAGSNNLLAQSIEFMLPNFRKNLKNLIHPCPYGPGYSGVSNSTVKNALFRGSLTPGENKVELRFSTVDNKTLFAMNIFTIQT
jgi:hypothetical protein